MHRGCGRLRVLNWCPKGSCNSKLLFCLFFFIKKQIFEKNDLILTK
jgi:hypothetical protein